MRIADTAGNPDIKKHYLEVAQVYLSLAEAEQNLAAELERLNITSTDVQAESKSH
jgi:hypothetical protein